MRPIERSCLYALLALSVLLAWRHGPVSAPAHARQDASAPDAARIAVCSVVKVTDELMNTDRFKPERQEYEEQLRTDQLKPLVEQLEALRDKLEAMDRQSPEFQEGREQFARLQREAQAVGQQVAQKVELKVAEQLKECYMLVRSSAQAIAEDLGYSYVLASADPEEELQKGPVVSIMRDLLSRPVIMYPVKADITEDVRKDLKLE